MFGHYSMQNLFSCKMSGAVLAYAAQFKYHDNISMGFRSGLWLGQSIKFHFFFFLPVGLQSICLWKAQFWFYSTFGQMALQYLEFITESATASCPVPEAAKEPQTPLTVAKQLTFVCAEQIIPKGLVFAYMFIGKLLAFSLHANTISFWPQARTFWHQ